MTLFPGCVSRAVRRATVCLGILAMVPASLLSQSAAFSACTASALTNCSVIQLTSQLGAGPGGLNLFEIAVRNLGSTSSPSLATSIYNLVFSTGAPTAPGNEVDALVTPNAQGGATVSDPSPWSLFDSGDAIFLSALSNNGVGGCVGGASVAGFGQAGQTCGDNSFLSFGFFTTRAYDPNAFSLLDLEVVGLSADLPADSCSGGSPCVVAPVTATPEPSSIALTLTGLVGLASHVRRRRKAPLAMPSLQEG